MVADYPLEFKVFLLLSIISTLPIPKIYRFLKAKSSISASSAGGSAQSLQGTTVPSRRPATAGTSASQFSSGEIDLEQGGSVAPNTIGGLKGGGVITPPLDVKAVFEHLRKAQETLPQTEPQKRIETESGEAGINFTNREPDIDESQQGRQPRLRDTAKRTEKARDRSDIGNFEAWCCTCGWIGAFPQQKCANCMSDFCSSCAMVE